MKSLFKYSFGFEKIQGTLVHPPTLTHEMETTVKSILYFLDIHKEEIVDFSILIYIPIAK
jgi:hypothetical protein